MNKKRVNSLEAKIQSLQGSSLKSRYTLDFTENTTADLVEALDNIETYRLCFYLQSKLIYFLPKSFLEALELDPKEFSLAPKDALFNADHFIAPFEVVDPLINTLEKTLVIEIKE